MANPNEQTNGQAKVTPIPQPIPRTEDKAKATEVHAGGERMPNPESQAAKDARQTEASKPKDLTVVSTGMDFTDRWAVLMQDDNGNWAAVCIEPVTKPRLGKVSTVDKKGEPCAPKANYNMSAFGRISIDLNKDRTNRVDGETKGKSPMLFSPPSIYSPATQYEIANSSKTAGSTEHAANERESIDF